MKTIYPFVIPNSGSICWLDRDGLPCELLTDEGKPFVVQYSGTDKRHLHQAVLAENISVTQEPKYKTLDIEFDFLCPNCGKRHWARETACMYLFSCMGIQLACGWVSIRLPWAAQAPRREQESIYGQKA
jgi:hypothetical protein